MGKKMRHHFIRLQNTSKTQNLHVFCCVITWYTLSKSTAHGIVQPVVAMPL